MTETTEAERDRAWDELLAAGSEGSEMAAPVAARVRSMRAVVRDGVPVLGRLVDDAFPRREGESGAGYEQRRCDLLIGAAFVLFGNCRPEKLNTATFLEYVQGVATTVAIAAGAPPPPPPHERLAEIADVLDAQLKFGEEYAIALFGANACAWKTSARGEIGIAMFESAAKLAREQESERKQTEMFAALDVVLSGIAGKGKGKGKGKAPEPESAPAHAATAGDAPPPA